MELSYQLISKVGCWGADSGWLRHFDDSGLEAYQVPSLLYIYAVTR
jgi:hypothetical protein